MNPSDTVTIAMASFPPRKSGMLRVIGELLPQCDHMYVYLNGYTTIPSEMPSCEKLTALPAGPGTARPDLGAHGKFNWALSVAGHYLTVDDDILYPPDYVRHVVEAINKYRRLAIVGMHGIRLRVDDARRIPEAGSVRAHRAMLHYADGRKADMAAHILGTGVMGMHPATIRLDASAYAGRLHSGVDSDVAVWAQRRRVPMVCLSARANWLRADAQSWVIDPLHRRLETQAATDAKLRAHVRWTFYRPQP